MSEIRETSGINRRQFVQLAVTAACAGGAAIGMASCAGTGGMGGGGVPIISGPVDVGPVTAFKQSPEQNMIDASHSRQGCLLVQQQGRLYALSSICTHQGCAVNADAKGTRFDCPCHGSQFALDGAVLSGLATRPLPRLTISLNTLGHVIVDPSRPLTLQEANSPQAFVSLTT